MELLENSTAINVMNRESIGTKKITCVGASYKFVHKVLRDMLIVGGFNDVEICVHDLREKPLKIVGDLLEKIARQQKTNVKITRTLDLEEALRGTDVVVLSISTGGGEAHYRNFESCMKYGIKTGIGDTLGPCALARNLTTVPVVVNLVKKMEELCPNALMLNFSNPMSVVTGAMARHSNIPCWGLCHSADELYSYFARVFNCKKEEVEIDMGGVNHQSFVTKLLIKGIDQTKNILKATEESNAQLEDNLLETHQEDITTQQDIYKLLGAWPSTGDTHLAEFYPFHYTDRAMDAYGYRHKVKPLIPGREEQVWSTPHPIIMEWTYGDGPVEDLEKLTTEHAHELLWSFFTDEPHTRYINMLNTGNYIEGLPANACVEAQVTASGSKLSGKTITLPPAVNSLVQRWTTIHDLSITAALECDRDAARQALFLDPHVKEIFDIAPLLEDLLLVNKDWLSEKWFN